MDEARDEVLMTLNDLYTDKSSNEQVEQEGHNALFVNAVAMSFLRRIARKASSRSGNDEAAHMDSGF